jgi:hypothetical protein
MQCLGARPQGRELRCRNSLFWGTELECIVHCKTLTRLRAQARGKANNSRPSITAGPAAKSSWSTYCMPRMRFGESAADADTLTRARPLATSTESVSCHTEVGMHVGHRNEK